MAVGESSMLYFEKMEDEHLPLYAIYRVPKVLIGGDEEGEGDEEDDRRLVVKSKDIVVDAVVVELDQTTHRTEHVVHHRPGTLCSLGSR